MNSVLVAFGPRAFFLASSVGMAILYWPITSVHPCYDEWQWLLPAQAIRATEAWADIWDLFRQPVGQFYRPLSSLPMALANGSDLSSALRVKIFAVIGIALLVVLLMKRAQEKNSWAWLTGSVFLLHQCLVLPGEIDWWGDTICDAALLLLFILHSSSRFFGLSSLSRFLLTALLTATAAWAKEAGVTAPIVILLGGWMGLGIVQFWRQTTASVTASFAVVVLYIVARLSVGSALTVDGDDYYRLQLGKNLVLNPALLVAGTYSPINTVWVAMGGIQPKLLAGAWTMLGLAMVLWGAIKGGFIKSKVFWSLMATSIAIQGPTLLMPHISEGNFARSLPFTLTLSAICVKYLWGCLGRVWQVVLVVMLILWCGLHVNAVHAKVQDIIAIHHKAALFRDKFKELIPIPLSRPVKLTIETSPNGYSYYRQPLALLALGDADLGMQYEYQDTTFRVDIVFVSDAHRDSFEVGTDIILWRDESLTRAHVNN